MALNNILFRQIDNSALIVFRIFFGLLCALEAFGAIVTGWVRQVLVEPQFTFSFIGFEWLQPLPGSGMYIYYAIMGVFALMIMLGYKYRFSMVAFTLLWTGSYLMQKSSYNNHYYLLMLLSAIMVFLPANRYASLDAKWNPSIKKINMPYWCKLVFVMQLLIVYTYAAIAKLYPDWFNTNFIEVLMRGKINHVFIGGFLQQKWLHNLLVYGGVLFDALVIPLLLYKPTRKWIFAISIIFHLFNSIVLHIGIFPYLSLAFSLFFFEAKTIQKLFLKRKPFYSGAEIEIPRFRRLFLSVFLVYFTVQLILPLRHHFITGDVLWTEEGHRLSWRMMLRSRSGLTTYTVVDKASDAKFVIDMSNYLTPKQQRSASSKPDIMWQFAQRLHEEFKKNGQDVAVYVDAKVSINGAPFQQLTDPNVDLASVQWQPLEHSSWILPYNSEKRK